MVIVRTAVAGVPNVALVGELRARSTFLSGAVTPAFKMGILKVLEVVPVGKVKVPEVDV